MKRRAFIQNLIKLGAIASPLLTWAAEAQAQFNKTVFAQKNFPSLHFPGSQQFKSLKKIVNRLLLLDEPVAILQTDNETELKSVLTIAQHNKVPLFVRSGGHSFEGFSIGHGLVIDTRQLKQVTIDLAQNRVEAGAGLLLGELNYELEKQGYTFPTGSCPTVGLSGYLLGGGHSQTSRLHGLGCDRVQAMDVTLFDGTSLFVSSEQHQDLYWALLGGGGGNFALVTRFYLDLIPRSPKIFYSLTGQPMDHSQFFSDWEQLMLDAPDGFSPHLFVSFAHGRLRSVRMSGSLINLQHDPEQPAGDILKQYLPSDIRAHFRQGHQKVEWAKGIQSPSLLEIQTSFKASSFYADAPLGESTYQDFERILKQYSAALNGTMDFSPFGGRILNPARENSYPHRNSFYCLGTFILIKKRHEKKDFIEKANALHKELAPLFANRHYVNYPDLNLTTSSDPTQWAQKYYGDSLPDLLAVKRKYDPHNHFNFGQHSLSSLL